MTALWILLTGIAATLAVLIFNHLLHRGADDE
jgi:hypothetical protein